MQLSQSALFYLCCASFVLGSLLSLLYDVIWIMRLWAMPSQLRYNIPTIQKLRASRPQRRTPPKKRRLPVAIFFGDVFFCLMSAIALILLLYWLNNGTFRAAAPLCMAVGFWLWRISISKHVRALLQWLVFAIESFFYMLFIPFKRLFNIFMTAYKKNAHKRHAKRLTAQRKNYTKQTLQSVEKAATSLIFTQTATRIQKGEARAKQRKKAV